MNLSETIKQMYGFTPSEEEVKKIMKAAITDSHKRYCRSCDKVTERIILDDMCGECYDKRN